jgi:hypothetical protein
MLALSLTVGVLCAAPSDAPPFPPEKARLHISLRVPKDGPVIVRLQADRTRWPDGHRAAFANLPDSHMAAFSPPIKLVGGDRSPLDIQYRVRIPDVEAADEGPVLFGAFDTPNGRHLPLDALVPVVRPMGSSTHMLDLSPALVDVDSELPITTSLPGGDGHYWATTSAELYAAIVMAGPTATAKASGGLTLASFDFDADALKRLSDLEKRAAPALERSFGPRGPLSFLAVYSEPKHRAAVMVLGLNDGVTAAILSKGIPDGRATSSAGTVMLHELIHSYLPPDHNLPHWITEGFTEYFGHRYALTLDGLPDAMLYERLYRMSSDFSWRVRGKRTSQDELGDYLGGAVLAYCIDTRLKKDKSSLEEVLATTRRRSEGKVDNAQWEQTIAVASAPAGALVLNAKTEPIDGVHVCFKEAGIESTFGTFMVTKDFAAERLGLIRVEEDPNRYDLFVRESAGLFFPGDAIVAVDGVRVAHLEELYEMLFVAGTEQPPRKHTFLVSRKGTLQKVTFEVPFPELSDRTDNRRSYWKKH